MSSECDHDIYHNGESLGLFDMPKDEAEALVVRLTEETGIKHDWHYAAGRVHLKRAKTPAPKSNLPESDWA